MVLSVPILQYTHFSVANHAFLSTGPVASFVMTTFSCRICMFVGGLLSAISCLTSAFVGSVDILILTYGVIGGTCMVNCCLLSKKSYLGCCHVNLISSATVNV